MVIRGTSGPNPNAAKSYYSHTIARGGQWRNLKPTPTIKKEVKVNIREYNYDRSYGYTGFQLPAWLQWTKFGMDWINQFIPQPKAAVQPQEDNPFAKELEDLKNEIEELKKENEELKKEPAKLEDPTKVETTKVEVDDNFDVEATAEDVVKEEETEQALTTEAVVNKGRKRADGKVEYQGWQTLTNAYGVPNTKEFRNWFRQNHMNGKDIWEIGTQNFPTKITYNGQEYTFNGDKFAKPLDIHDNSGTGSVTTANMDKKTEKQTTTTTTFQGAAKATWTDEKGQEHTVTHKTKNKNFEDKDSAKKAALQEIKNQVPEKYRQNAKFSAGAGEA